MSHATAASLPQRTRRRGRTPASASVGALELPYRHAPARRPQAMEILADFDDEPGAWPNWLIPSALISVMASISAYHFDALMAALRAVILT